MSIKRFISNQSRNIHHSRNAQTQNKQDISVNSKIPSEGKQNRYHLYMSYACPFAHRAMLVRSLKGLDKVISASALWVDNESRYIFSGNPDEGSIDPYNKKKTLMDVYKMNKFKSKATVPALFDINSNRIINNKSAEIMRMFNSSFNEFAEYPNHDFYPCNLRKTIDSTSEWIHRDINKGVYSVGAAIRQIIYDKQVGKVFEALDKAEEILSKQRYMCGDILTEADLKLFPSLIRFDSIYYTLFYCNKKMLREYEHLSGYMREIYQIPGVESTVSTEHIKAIYMKYRKDNNPRRIIPIGPTVDLHSPHGRDHI
ncbi:Glutathione S-transferase family protein isoform 1 [Oopsacas minuta]|uniref:Glutathione S-transferase family protein isoform 1 n=1 Tax=Oopsacas minuta TaxID=111878 RepID=A0AAV7JT01_9METZ|nr:Glutathione S-transferase family protein isoform 1 [Oopsacas minuta]